MQVNELIKLLSVYDPDTEIDFIVSDKDDNYDGELFINENTNGIELSIEIDDSFVVCVKEKDK